MYRVMVDMRVEDGHFFFRTGEYPCGSEYILMPCGCDEDDNRTFKAVEVWDGQPPYNYRDWVKDEQANTAPRGYVWMNNNKSRFGGERKSVLLRLERRH